MPANGISPDDPRKAKLSVITAVYNGEEFLEQCLDSVLSQSKADFEFVIINDGSRDRSAEILERYRNQDSRIVLVSQANSGIAASLNRAVSVASGELLAHIDQDDLALPSWLEKQVAFLAAHPESSVVSSYAFFINAAGERIGTSRNPVDVERGRAELNPDRFLDVIHSTVVMRKKDIIEAGGYREGLMGVEDRELWGRLVTSGKMIRCNPEVLVGYRLHGESATVKKVNVADANLRKGINHNIVRRLRGERELTSEELGIWFANRPLLEKLNESRRRNAGRYFRSASRHYADKRWLKLFWTLGIAAALRPVHVLRRAFQKTVG